MNQTFNYRQKFYFSYFYPVIAFVVLAVLCEFYSYGIAIKNLHLLAYPNSFYLMCACAVIFGCYVLYKYLNYAKSKKNPNPIKMEESEFSFPKGGNEKITVKYNEIKELYNKSDSDDGEQIIIHTKDSNRYEFSADNFDNVSEFNLFKNAILKKQPTIK